MFYLDEKVTGVQEYYL